MKFLLLVTWFVNNQPPSNYQVTFSSSEACGAARLQVLKEAERMRQDEIDRARGTGLGKLAGLGATSVSAVCVTQ
jgi:hypothetical protein